MKVCCIKRFGPAHTCADCHDYLSCSILQGFYSKNGYKYRKHQESLEFIRAHGYDAFLKMAEKWKGPRGRLS